MTTCVRPGFCTCTIACVPASHEACPARIRAARAAAPWGRAQGGDPGEPCCLDCRRLARRRPGQSPQPARRPPEAVTAGDRRGPAAADCDVAAPRAAVGAYAAGL